jgi:hypothetical protein
MRKLQTSFTQHPSRASGCEMRVNPRLLLTDAVAPEASAGGLQMPQMTSTRRTLRLSMRSFIILLMFTVITAADQPPARTPMVRPVQCIVSMSFAKSYITPFMVEMTMINAELAARIRDRVEVALAAEHFSLWESPFTMIRGEIRVAPRLTWYLPTVGVGYFLTINRDWWPFGGNKGLFVSAALARCDLNAMVCPRTSIRPLPLIISLGEVTYGPWLPSFSFYGRERGNFLLAISILKLGVYF